MDVRIEPSWKAKLKGEFEKPYFHDLVSFVKGAYAKGAIYPKGGDIFRAFDLCPFDKVRVVILGQDPYHGPKQAHGLCFSVPEGVPAPPSLVNILSELKRDCQVERKRADLSDWAQSGVLLLNAILTVEARQPGSHRGKGWETFTDAVIQILSEEKEGLVFLLWGAYAQEKGSVIDRRKHLVLTTSHPSPFSVYRGFHGSAPFSKVNRYLEERGESPIPW